MKSKIIEAILKNATNVIAHRGQCIMCEINPDELANEIMKIIKIVVDETDEARQ